jgi:hypothetical protein
MPLAPVVPLCRRWRALGSPHQPWLPGQVHELKPNGRHPESFHQLAAGGPSLIAWSCNTILLGCKPKPPKIPAARPGRHIATEIGRADSNFPYFTQNTESCDANSEPDAATRPALEAGANHQKPECRRWRNFRRFGLTAPITIRMTTQLSRFTSWESTSDGRSRICCSKRSVTLSSSTRQPRLLADGQGRGLDPFTCAYVHA